MHNRVEITYHENEEPTIYTFDDKEQATEKFKELYDAEPPFATLWLYLENIKLMGFDRT